MSTASELNTARVAEAFDGVAETFESTLENDITRSIRRKVYSIVGSLVPHGSAILDINCGIGIDAVELAKKGYSVAGADLSPRMLEQARLRAAAQGVNIEFFESSFEEPSPFADRKFDLVLSNFGGLNCIDSLTKVAEQVARVTKPGGYFVAVVMPPVSLWELVAGITRLNFGFAFRRLRNNAQATGFGGRPFTVSYYTPCRFASAFSRSFVVEQVRGLNIISPPPHATKFAARFPQLSSWLARTEDSIGSLPVLRAVGDHYVVVLGRKK